MNNTKAVPVEKWYVRIENIVDDGAALDAWLSLIRAQGWSPVGEPEISRDRANSGVVGRMVRHPGLIVRADIHDAIRVPA